VQTLELKLAADNAAPAAARRQVAESGIVAHNRLADALLLISELVTNAVKHGSTESGFIGLKVRADPGMLRVEVEADGAGFTPPADSDLVVPQSGGMGLRLLRSVADRWGIDPSPSTLRTVVWFEFESV
jgi:anti-sigma regulatory factor (Ser/Thr protein kinase)